jgi:phosphoribosylformylglycinamidine (FGAM) synthase PurS component
MIAHSVLGQATLAQPVEKGQHHVRRKFLAVMIFEAAIDLSITDNTAYTVLVALKQLGYDALSAVERSEIYRLTLSGDMAPEDVAGALLRAEIVFNPNKHRLSYESRAVPAGTPMREEWEAVIADRDDDTSRVRRLLAERFGVHGLERLERSTAWRLFENDRPASKERLEWACRALLCNPYSQVATVRARPHRTVAGESAAVVER